ncbi:MAG TPA: hypothetical protein VIF32_08005 [Gemmatimonadaceae bacterium]|jgi:hypothetical protein
MKKLGCLVVLALLAVVAFWAYKTGWIRFGRPSAAESGARAAETWQPLTPDGATRAGTALQQLNSPRGPVYVNVAPGDLAAYIFMQMTRFFPADADSIQAAAIGDRLYVRAIVATKSLGGSGSLGPLSALLGERERVQLGGTLHIVRPGVAELQVKEAKIGNLSLPQALIPRVINQMSHTMRTPDLAPDGLPLRTPPYIGDVRVSNGQITLYKTARTP